MTHPFSLNQRPTFGAVRILETPLMYTTREDWSAVRSPARARRRMRQGHRQNVVFRGEPINAAFTADGCTYYVHPVIAEKLRRVLSERINRDTYNVLAGEHANLILADDIGVMKS